MVGKRHDCRMGSGRITPMTPDLVSTVVPREPSSPPLNPPITTADNAASSPRHVLPSDLPAAIKHLNDQELEQLMAAVYLCHFRSARCHRTFQFRLLLLYVALAIGCSMG